MTHVMNAAPRMFINGTEVSYASQAAGTNPDLALTGVIGVGTSASNCYQGEIEGNMDEARISDVSLSPSWILTEYNNQSSPSTFYTVGSEL